MKKGVTILLSFMAICLSILTFSGCNMQDSISNISISALPTKTSYIVGEGIDLDGGILSVEYQSGKRETYPLSIATPSILTFDTEGSSIVVYFSYGGKQTSMGINVEKGDLDIDSVVIPNTPYNLLPQPIVLDDILSLPDGVTYSVEYKLDTADNSTYTTTAPTNAGTYSARITILGGDNYKDLCVGNNNAIVTNYTILKASLQTLSSQVDGTQYLDYDMSSLGSITYGDTVDLARRWTLETAESSNLGLAPLPLSIREKIKYQYKEENATIWQDMPVGENEIVSVLIDAGQYDMRVCLLNDANINDWEKSFALNISQRELILNTDFTLQLVNLDEYTDLSLIEENTTTVTYDGSPYALYLKPSTALVGQISLNESVNYSKANDSTINSQAPATVGEYVITYGIDGGTNYVSTQRLTTQFNIEKMPLGVTESMFSLMVESYTGEAISFVFDDSKLAEDISYVISYALQTEGEKVYTTTAPTERGVYSVKIEITRNTADTVNYEIEASVWLEDGLTIE